MIEFDYNEAIQMLIDNLGDEKAQVLIDEFKDLIKVAIESAWIALDNKNYEEFGLQCHTIKSNSAILGEIDLECLCAEIDDITYNKEFKKIPDIEDEFIRLSKNIYKKL